ncbi:protein spindle-F [Calliphora vicina]|uniref:protein spindle-F n=1 Tax=Calliphora vicina TaxID=7373 RepID=UPI00325B4727
MDTLSPGNPNSSNQKQHLALRVALDTMKDRCILQQKRLSELEEENQQLRERLTQNNKSSGNASHNAGGVAENFQLRLQVSELQRQNVQLNAHINMVSAENRKLWQRLSQMAKDQSRTVKDKDSTLTNTSGGGGVVASDEGLSPRGGNGSANQNLIRSKTFTQHSPNPNLRHKLLSTDNCGSSEMLDVSLEADVALEVFGDESARQQTGADNDTGVAQVAMGFGFLNVDDSASNTSSQEQDFNIEARKCMEGLQEMRREAMKQQQDLNSVFALLESRIALQPCPECVKKSNKPEMADKSLETDESFNDVTKYTNTTTTNELNSIYADSSAKVIPMVQSNHMNIIQEKIIADETNNMCPMCGKIYGSQVTFESFCEHVEEHFHDDNIQDVDHSMEHNFELISHTVGDF